jgi:hypothetical protein
VINENNPKNARIKNIPVIPSTMLIKSGKNMNSFTIRYIEKNNNRFLNKPNWKRARLIQAKRSNNPNNFSGMINTF